MPGVVFLIRPLGGKQMQIHWPPPPNWELRFLRKRIATKRRNIIEFCPEGVGTMRLSIRSERVRW